MELSVVIFFVVHTVVLSIKTAFNLGKIHLLFAILANENPNFMQFSSEQKLIYLLNPTTTAHVKIIGFYIIKSLELRTKVP
jgi:hypothetical protein